MKNIDLYKELVVAVSKETGVEEIDIIHSNSEEAVDARYILIHLLSQKAHRYPNIFRYEINPSVSKQDPEQLPVQDQEMECSNELATY